MRATLSTNLLTLTFLTCLVLTPISGLYGFDLLDGQADHLPMRTIFSDAEWPPGISATLEDNGGTFDGTWGADAHPNWRGTFTATGPQPNGNNSGQTDFDFTGLPLGFLPTGSIIVFGDFDRNENSRVSALDSFGNVIESPWLFETFAVKGFGATGGPPEQIYLPGYDWDVTFDNHYYLHGTTISGNPSIALALKTSQNITGLSVTKTSANSFGIMAPNAIPEPGSLLCLGGMASLFAFRRRR